MASAMFGRSWGHGVFPASDRITVEPITDVIVGDSRAPMADDRTLIATALIAHEDFGASPS